MTGNDIAEELRALAREMRTRWHVRALNAAAAGEVNATAFVFEGFAAEVEAIAARLDRGADEDATKKRRRSRHRPAPEVTGSRVGAEPVGETSLHRSGPLP